MSQDENRPEFSYFLSSNNSIVVATLVGDIDSASEAVLLRCKEEIASFQEARLVILYFRDVNHIATEAVALLTRLQMSIRASGCQLSICSLKPSIKERFVKIGVVRASETADNLQAALQSFSLRFKRSA